ncbi:MAG: VCBS repeat-containing protein [Fimbriimonadaceae bacterium]|nr:VCBS repeat-containing protein [Alphaproteobacteria bacterium]
MMTKFRFRHHLIDQGLPRKSYAQTALADLDNDGRLEFIMGQQYGTIFWYKFHAPNQWTRHLLGENSPSDVGGCVLDVDQDGYIDYVAGGAWYRNSRDPEQPFQRFVFDPDLTGVHDVVAADIDGDGQSEIITMSDQNDLRWYKIPEDPTQPWSKIIIGPAVHAGVAVGDIDGDGDLDIVRTNVWFENVKGDGSKWQVRPIGPNTYPPPDFQLQFTFDATRAVVCDMNGDGKNDIVFTDAEIPGGKIWWMENIDGLGNVWQRHDIPNADDGRRGAYHSLYVGDLDGDGDFDIFSCEMEQVHGNAQPRWFIWENVDGRGSQWQEHVILDANLGGHEAVVGDITGNGFPDIIAKPWVAHKSNALDGDMFVLFLENLGNA